MRNNKTNNKEETMNKKLYKDISNKIRENYKWHRNDKGEYQCYVDINVIDDLAKYFRDLDISKLEKNAKSKLNFNYFKFVRNSIPPMTLNNTKELKHKGVLNN